MNFSGFRGGFDAVASDCRYAFQALCRRPKFTTIAVLTIALGIGAATSMFTVVDHVLVRPLKYKDADRLVTVAYRENGGLKAGADELIEHPCQEWTSLHRRHGFWNVLDDAAQAHAEAARQDDRLHSRSL